MRLKPKNTVGNPKALLYRRFTSLEKSINMQTVYKTISNNLFWTFDNETQTFSQIESNLIPSTSSVVLVENNITILQYLSIYFKYNGTEWERLTSLPQDVTLLSATFNNISKYQTNKYYYAGSFDYIIKGSIEGTTTQYVKGNIIPLTSFNIKYFDDDITISVDALVVINGRLYSVENPETVQKRQPKAFNVYFATLNSVL